MSNVIANPSRPRRVVRKPIAAPVDSLTNSGAVSPGQWLQKTTNNGVASATTLASSANVVGVCNDLNPLVFADGVTGSQNPPNDATVTAVTVTEDGDHLFNTTAADTYHPYDPVTIGGSDGRTITNTISTGTVIGYVSPDQRLNTSQVMPSFPITGGTGVQIYVHITPPLAK